MSEGRRDSAFATHAVLQAEKLPGTTPQVRRKRTARTASSTTQQPPVVGRLMDQSARPDFRMARPFLCFRALRRGETGETPDLHSVAFLGMPKQLRTSRPRLASDPRANSQCRSSQAALAPRLLPAQRLLQQILHHPRTATDSVAGQDEDRHQRARGHDVRTRHAKGRAARTRTPATSMRHWSTMITWFVGRSVI